MKHSFPSPKHRPLLLLLLLLSSLCSLLFNPIPITAETSPTPQKPNVLLILVDDLGRERVSCFGAEEQQTPNIDAMAARGMRYDNFHAMPVCHPTRVALISGRYLHTMGNPKWGYYVTGDRKAAAEQETLAHVMKRAGYATVAAGKWHLQMLKKDPQQPHRMGFDEYCFFGWHEGPRYWDPLLYENGQLREDTAGAYGPDLYLQFILDFFKKHEARKTGTAEAGADHQPVFAYYPMALSHAVSDDLAPNHPPHGPNGRYMTVTEMVDDIDRLMGELTAALEEMGLTNNTLIFFTTDNGTSQHYFSKHENGELVRVYPGPVAFRGGLKVKGGKGTYTDWGTRVPTFALWPGHIPPGASTDALTDMCDLLPTFAHLTGVASPGAPGDSPSNAAMKAKQETALGFPTDGQSFAPLLTGEESALKFFPGRDWIAPQTRDNIAIRTRSWKLTRKDGGQLYDLENDPLEQHPIPAKKDTETTAQVRAELEALMAGFGFEVGSGKGEGDDKEKKDGEKKGKE